MKFQDDERVVMTLDAGGTNFVFGAVQGCKEIIEPIHLPSAAHNLELCLANLRNGFHAVRSTLQESSQTPVAISFAFPGPADYPRGIIGDLGNLPAFRGGVALGPMLAKEFGIPVYINNDGDLYAYGEAIAGFLPWVNSQLEKGGSPKRFKNLVGFTLGTGFGGGVVRDGQLALGDNSGATEVWLMSQRYSQCCNIEESISIRAVKREYATLTGIDFDKAPSPKDIYEIGIGAMEGDRKASLEAFRLMGKALGDAMCNILTIVDGLAVIGGGVSGARKLFIPAMLEEMRSSYTNAVGQSYPRLVQKAFYLDDPTQLEEFIKGDIRQVQIPNSNEKITYDPLSRVGIGFSQIGTSRAISIGAYAYAINTLDTK
ncbi:MAG: ROK family protein [Mucinivorans sp.]